MILKAAQAVIYIILEFPAEQPLSSKRRKSLIQFHLKVSFVRFQTSILLNQPAFADGLRHCCLFSAWRQSSLSSSFLIGENGYSAVFFCYNTLQISYSTTKTNHDVTHFCHLIFRREREFKAEAAAVADAGVVVALAQRRCVDCNHEIRCERSVQTPMSAG
jgi:hypothetical protein